MPDLPRDPAAPDTVVLRRYLDAVCTDAERVRVERWLAADPVANEAQLGVLRGIIRGIASVEPGRFDVRGARQRVLDRIAATKASPFVQHRATSSQPTPDRAASRGVVPKPWPQGAGVGAEGRRRWWEGRAGQRPAPTTAIAIAAMVVAAVGVGVAIRHRSAPASAGRAYATAAGQRLSVTLVDGTRLTLAPASRVRLAAEYGEGKAGGSKTRPYGVRDVELEGEAYFAVVHDAAHPFAVHAHGAVARDVGTAFDVRAYPEDLEARIAVAEGTVAIEPSATWSSREQPLQAGDVATVRQGKVAVEHGVDVAGLTGWMRGELAFHDVPLGEVVAELSRWYGLDVRLADASLANRRLRGVYGSEQSVTEVVGLVAPALGLRAQWDGPNRVTLAPATSGTRRSVEQ